MTWSLFDELGRRKYLTAGEREAFLTAATRADPATRLFCLTLALSGARISEVLRLQSRQIDAGTNTIAFESLKRRRRGVYRAVPLPEPIIRELLVFAEQKERDGKLWPWCRTTGWRRIKEVMDSAGVPPEVATPRALRHAFGVCASQRRIVLSLIQKWLGHARIETTAIYATPAGEEERALAALTWGAPIWADTIPSKIPSGDMLANEPEAT